MTKPLINQPSAAPSRKWWVGLLAGAATGAISGAAAVLWPDADLTPLLQQVDKWVTLGVAFAAAYMARNRA